MSTSTHDISAFKSPESECIDNNQEVSEVKSMETTTDEDDNDKVVDIDKNGFCATTACDIYKHLRESETNKRTSMDFMEKIQKDDINPSKRAILVDWLVEIAEENFVSDTVFLAVNYIDRYLSGNTMNKNKLQLLGVACMMIAAKFEEGLTVPAGWWCDYTANTYTKEGVLQMESSVLQYLKFEMTAPTVMCFLRRFYFVAQETSGSEGPSARCLVSYIAELSLVEYSILCYAPSLVAASAVFLAKYILSPSKKPWNSTLRHYALYQASDLCDCVKALHDLFCCNYYSSEVLAVRQKYCGNKYKSVGNLYCPPEILPELF